MPSLQKRNFTVLLILIAWVMARLFLSETKLETTSNVTYRLQEQEDRVDDHYSFHNTTWPPMKKALCGEGAPNLMLSNVLFHLARSQVFAQDDPRLPDRFKTTNAMSSVSKCQSQFFAGDFGASILIGTNENGKSFATLYCRIFKNGNNQIRWMEKKLQRRIESWNKTNVHAVYSEMNLGHALSKFLPQASNDAPLCIYTAVRDPISHFLSGYNEIEFRQLGEFNNESCKDWPKDDKPLPYHLSVPYSSESPDLRRKRFRGFVKDLLLEHDFFATNYIYKHAFTMSRILVVLKKYNHQLTGYIPTIQNLPSTWPEFMSSTCTNFPSVDSIPTMKKQGQHRSSNDRLGLYRAAKDVWEEQGPIARSLCLLHAYDYACFDAMATDIPPLCQEVFRDHAERIVDFASEHYFVYNPPWSNSSDDEE